VAAGGTLPTSVQTTDTKALPYVKRRGGVAPSNGKARSTANTADDDDDDEDDVLDQFDDDDDENE
jgi:hypothetical protein